MLGSGGVRSLFPVPSLNQERNINDLGCKDRFEEGGIFEKRSGVL